MKCPKCGEKMRYAIDTPYAMDGKSEDNTNMYEYLQCSKCEYYEPYRGGGIK